MSTIGCREIVDVSVLLYALAVTISGTIWDYLGLGEGLLCCSAGVGNTLFMNYECLLIQLCIIMQGWSFLIGK